MQSAVPVRARNRLGLGRNHLLLRRSHGDEDESGTTPGDELRRGPARGRITAQPHRRAMLHELHSCVFLAEGSAAKPRRRQQWRSDPRA